MSEGANEGNGWRGRLEEKVNQLESWKSDHTKEHAVMRDEIRESTRRNDRWSGALAVLILFLSIVGPLIAARLVEGKHP